MIYHISPINPIDSNIYLLTGSKNIIIDSGTGLSSRAIIDEIHSILAHSKIDYLLLTHCHFDHIGGALDFVDAFGCEVCAGFVDAVPIREGDHSYTLCRDFGLDIPPVPCSNLQHGDIIDIGDHRLEVISTPGHTLGGVCFYDQITKSLFSGDTLFSDGVGRTDFKGGSLASLRNSIKYLSTIPLNAIYPGHGRPNVDGQGAVKRGLLIVGD